MASKSDVLIFLPLCVLCFALLGVRRSPSLLHFTSHFLAMTRKWLWRLEPPAQPCSLPGGNRLSRSRKKGEEIQKQRKYKCSFLAL